MECSWGALGGQIWLCAKQLSTACKVKLRHYKYLFNCLQNHRNWVSNICHLLLLIHPTMPIRLVTDYPNFCIIDFCFNQKKKKKKERKWVWMHAPIWHLEMSDLPALGGFGPHAIWIHFQSFPLSCIR
jgi:hypothetical protein